MSRELTITKGDLLLESKRADASLASEDGGWAMFFFNTPKKGKCLSAEYTPGDWPAAIIVVSANWKAERVIRRYKRGGWVEVAYIT